MIIINSSFTSLDFCKIFISLYLHNSSIKRQVATSRAAELDTPPPIGTRDAMTASNGGTPTI